MNVNLKTIAASIVAVLALAAPAVAADMSTKAVPKQQSSYLPTSDPWTGIYIGVNGGYGFDLGQFGFGPASIADLAGSPQGFVGGLQAGLGTRLGNNFYIGIEGDIDGAAVNGTGSVPGTITAKSENSFLGSIRARFGIILNNDALIYATGGYGFGGGRFSLTDIANGANTTVNPTMSGGVWGGGLEYALSSNWLARVEYLQYDFGTFSAVMTPTSTSAPNILFTQRDRVDVIRGGISYKF